MKSFNQSISHSVSEPSNQSISQPFRFVFVVKLMSSSPYDLETFHGCRVALIFVIIVCDIGGLVAVPSGKYGMVVGWLGG